MYKKVEKTIYTNELKQGQLYFSALPEDWETENLHEWTGSVIFHVEHQMNGLQKDVRVVGMYFDCATSKTKTFDNVLPWWSCWLDFKDRTHWRVVDLNGDDGEEKALP